MCLLAFGAPLQLPRGVAVAERSVKRAVVQRVSVFQLSTTEPSRSSRANSAAPTLDPVVVEVELAGGVLGYGEAVPRAKVSGETSATVCSAVEEVYVPNLLDFHPESFPEAAEALEALPWQGTLGPLVPAARAAVELSLLDACLRFFERQPDDLVAWMGLPGFGRPGSSGRVRFGAVLPSVRPARVSKLLRGLRWRRLRDFKLPVGDVHGRDRLQQVIRCLGRALRRGRATLRLDAGGAWSKDEAIDFLSEAAAVPLTAVEQPLARGAEANLPILHDLFEVPLVHDESLVTLADAERLQKLEVADGFNLEVSKCGGLIPALHLAAYARRAGVRLQLGAASDGTGILAAADLQLLYLCPNVTWADGWPGVRELGSDVTSPSPRWRWAGKPARLSGRGLGVEADRTQLAQLCPDGALTLVL